MADHFQEVIEHERQSRRWMLPFAIALAVLLVIWLMFLVYL